MSNPIAFGCAPLTDEQRNRFDLLVDDERDRDWWAKVFACGAFIAGGAALFVFDKTQCVKRVGDVDIWTPRGFPLLEMVKSYCDLLKLRKIVAFIRLQNYIVTIVNPQRNIQFLTIGDQSLQEILESFDFDCVQCAIFSRPVTDRIGPVLRSSSSSKKTPKSELCVCVSNIAEEAIETRWIKWLNSIPWGFKAHHCPEAVQKRREEHRLHKLHTKGFLRFGQPVDSTLKATHECLAKHCEYNQYWQGDSSQLVPLDESVCTKIAEIEKRSGDSLQEYCEGKNPQNNWVLAPTWRQLVILEERKHISRIRTMWDAKKTSSEENARKKRLALRNFDLLIEGKVPMAEVRLSILSDALKCGVDAFGLHVDSAYHFKEDDYDTLARFVERCFT